MIAIVQTVLVCFVLLCPCILLEPEEFWDQIRSVIREAYNCELSGAALTKGLAYHGIPSKKVFKQTGVESKFQDPDMWVQVLNAASNNIFGLADFDPAREDYKTH